MGTLASHSTCCLHAHGNWHWVPLLPCITLSAILSIINIGYRSGVVCLVCCSSFIPRLRTVKRPRGRRATDRRWIARPLGRGYPGGGRIASPLPRGVGCRRHPARRTAEARRGSHRFERCVLRRGEPFCRVHRRPPRSFETTGTAGGDLVFGSRREAESGATREDRSRLPGVPVLGRRRLRRRASGPMAAMKPATEWDPCDEVGIRK